MGGGGGGGVGGWGTSAEKFKFPTLPITIIVINIKLIYINLIAMFYVFQMRIAKITTLNPLIVLFPFLTSLK